MKRVNVIGTSGSGKSHFSQKLAEKMGVPYIQLDAIYWQPNWSEPSNEAFFADLKSAISADVWVLDGNHSKTNHIKWQRTDTIIWLDFSFFRTFRQILSRSIKRAWTKGEIWKGTGNKESFRKSFLSSDSVILWMLTNYTKTKHKYGKLFNQNDLEETKLIRIRSPREAALFLKYTQKI